MVVHCWFQHQLNSGNGPAYNDDILSLKSCPSCSALALDGRNFHAWNYRQFIVKLLGVDSESELSYSSSLIAADFSNYSAWHYRTMLLPRLYNEDITTGAGPGEHGCKQRLTAVCLLEVSQCNRTREVQVIVSCLLLSPPCCVVHCNLEDTFKQIVVVWTCSDI